MAILQKLFFWFLEWVWGVVQKAYALMKQDKEEEKEVDDIIDKINSPNLEDQLDGIENAEDRLNSNT